MIFNPNWSLMTDQIDVIPIVRKQRNYTILRILESKDMPQKTFTTV
jgi:hypothetical protein